MSKHVKTSQNMSKHVKICQNMSKYVKICQNMSNTCEIPVKNVVNTTGCLHLMDLLTADAIIGLHGRSSAASNRMALRHRIPGGHKSRGSPAEMENSYRNG